MVPRHALNSLGLEDVDRVPAAYGPHYQRLVTLKKRYDPTNFFRMSQNPGPTTAAVASG